MHQLGTRTTQTRALLNLLAWTLDNFIRSYSDSLLHASLQGHVAPGDFEVQQSLLDIHLHYTHQMTAACTVG